MNFDEAVSAHVKWKIKLRMFLNGGSEKLESGSVGKDNMCELGKWIYGEGARYSNLPSYQVLKTKHAEFHRYASGVVRKIETGDKKGAETMLESAAFNDTSSKTVNAIMDMKRSAGK